MKRNFVIVCERSETVATNEILNGNELIVQGALEAGFSLYTGYPGSPLADYFNILHQKKKELESRGIKVAIANSEANGAAMASGAKQAGRDCLVAMKSMGLHVASDALSVGNFANPGPVFNDPETNEKVSPGVVIAVGDDPWSISTSTPADSRYLFKHLHIPFLEPSTPQELKDWMKVALYISRRTSVYQGVLLTTFMAEGGGRVKTGEWAEVSRDQVHLDPNKFDLSKNVMVPPNSLKADTTMINERFPKVKEVLKSLKLDKTYGDDNAQIGFLSSGVIFESLKQVLEEGSYLEHISLYKTACSYPLVDDFLVPWLRGLEKLIIVEEKRGFLEEQVTSLCQSHGIQLEIYGKQFKTSEGPKEGFVAHGGLTFESIRDKIAYLFELFDLPSCHDLNKSFLTLQGSQNLPKRLPTFCPGCPHRETLSLLKDLREVLKKDDIDLISHGDVGCYSLSFLPPFKEMHNLSAMGQGGALGAGLDLFTTNPSVVLMGDSTFFHSGMTDISNSLQCGHEITYILLDNDNTAMTGHQMTPRTGLSVDGKSRPKQDIVNLVKSLGVENVIEVQPSDRYFYKNLLIDYVKKPGVKVIVSNKECALTFHGRKKAQERKDFGLGKTQKVRSFFQINTEACEDCRVCVDLTGCPGLGQTEDAYGSKVVIDQQICVADSYCTKMKACPSFERVDVFDYHPTLYQKGSPTGQGDQIDHAVHENLPLPSSQISFDEIADGRDLRIVVTGVGGSGVTTISKVLSKAAKEMGGRDDIDFKFMDQKGLAQRNGNVTAHLSFYQKGKSRGAQTPLGTADLLMSPDLLDGPTHLGYLSQGGLCLLDNHFQIPVTMLIDRAEERPSLTEQELIESVKAKLADRALIASLKDVCYKTLGKSVYASAMILGVAYQTGRLPFSLSDMKEAFERAVPKLEFDKNWRAFGLGREWLVRGEEFMRNHYTNAVVAETNKREILKTLEKSLVESLLPWHTKKNLLSFYRRDLEMLCRFFPDIKKEFLARYMHDLYIYDRGAEIDSFMQDASLIKDSYSDPLEKEMALRVLVRTYFIKDEIYIAHIMVSPLLNQRDQATYSELGKSYKKVRINRPSFDVLGRKIEFDISPKTWMLKLMRHLRLLRILLPGWHKKEKQIAKQIRYELVGPVLKTPHGSRYQQLKKLENIKGYREVRYRAAEKYFNNSCQTKEVLEEVSESV